LRSGRWLRCVWASRLEVAPTKGRRCPAARLRSGRWLRCVWASRLEVAPTSVRRSGAPCRSGLRPRCGGQVDGCFLGEHCDWMPFARSCRAVMLDPCVAWSLLIRNTAYRSRVTRWSTCRGERASGFRRAAWRWSRAANRPSRTRSLRLADLPPEYSDPRSRPRARSSITCWSGWNPRPAVPDPANLPAQQEQPRSDRLPVTSRDLLALRGPRSPVRAGYRPRRSEAINDRCRGDPGSCGCAGHWCRHRCARPVRPNVRRSGCLRPWGSHAQPRHP